MFCLPSEQSSHLHVANKCDGSHEAPWKAMENFRPRALPAGLMGGHRTYHSGRSCKAVCADAVNIIGFRPGQGLHCSLHDNQEQDRVLTRSLPNTNGALHFRVVLTNFHIDQSTVVKANHDVELRSAALEHRRRYWGNRSDEVLRTGHLVAQYQRPFHRVNKECPRVKPVFLLRL
jgi:hypothetical protein